jgi:hypothetical protein
MVHYGRLQIQNWRYRGSLNVPGGAYVIIRQLPERNSECEYQIKSAREPHDRVDRESQLSAQSSSFGAVLTCCKMRFLLNGLKAQAAEGRASAVS